MAEYTPTTEHDRELIERCAQVVEELLPQTSSDQTHGYTMRSYTGATVAAAIRALSADVSPVEGR